MKNLIIKAWNSNTLMTQVSFITRSLSFFIPLPLILKLFSAEEIIVWYLLIGISALLGLFDMGFGVTFTRCIAYAMGGAKDIEKINNSNNNDGKPNWHLISEIIPTMSRVYNILSLVTVLLVLIFGTLSIYKPVQNIGINANNAWVGWAVLVLTIFFQIRGNVYISFLQGLNHIALLRRWEAITFLCAIISNVIVLLVSPGLLQLIISNQCWILIGVLRNYFLYRFVKSKNTELLKIGIFNSELFCKLWSKVWRSGLGVLFARLLIELSGIIVVNITVSSVASSYLFALRLMYALTQFSQAPFYSKIPLISRLYSSGKLNNQLEIVKRGMSISYWVFVIGFILIGLTAEPLLKMNNSNIIFVSPLLWGLMGYAFFAERYGAMHLQLYSVTNIIIWHIVNSISGLIYITASFLLYPFINIYAFPLGILIGYLGFYCWYSAKRSYGAFNLNFFNFESHTVLKPFLVLSAYSFAVLVIHSYSFNL